MEDWCCNCSHADIVADEVCSKKGLKAELSIHQVIYILALTYCHKLWLVTERIRLILWERVRGSG